MRLSPLPRCLLPAVLVAAVALALTASAGAQERPATRPGEDDHHEHAGFARLVQPMGAATLGLLVATAVTGALIRRKRKPLLVLHKLFGTLTLLSAICHAVLVAVAG